MKTCQTMLAQPKTMQTYKLNIYIYIYSYYTYTYLWKVNREYICIYRIRMHWVHLETMHGCQKMAAKALKLLCECSHLWAQSIRIWNWLQSQAKIARIGLSFQTFAAHVFGLLQGRQGKLLFRGLFPGLLLGRFLRTRSARGWRWCCWARSAAVRRGRPLGRSLWWAHPCKHSQNITTNYMHRFHTWNHLTLAQW